VFRRRRRHTRARRKVVVFLAVLAGIGAVIGLLAALRLSTAGRNLRSASDLIEEAGTALEDGRLADARANLDQASGLLTSATNALHGRAELDVISVMPVLGDNLAQLRESVGIAATLVSGGERILSAAVPLQAADGDLETPLVDGAIPVDAVRTIAREADLLVGALPGGDDQARTSLIGPVAELRDRVLEEAVHRKDQLRGVGAGMELLADMAGANGDRRYLIAVANTAEMRGGGGMVLSYGVLLSHNGDFELDEFGRIDELRLDEPLPRSSVPEVPTDYLERWRGFEPLELWRNATLAADFDMTASVLERMYELASGNDVSGVIQIDPHGLAALLEGVGPVEVPELGTVTADNVVDLVLNEAYIRFPDVDDRSDVLGDVAEAAFTRLVEGEYESLRPLGEALLRAVDGRHLLMHSEAAGPQNQLAFFGADGTLPTLDGPDAVALTVQNVSGNKLDFYVDTALELRGSREPGQVGHVQATITVTNTAPPGVTQPQYVFGPFNDLQEAGLYRGSISLYLPAGASLAGVAGGDAPPDPPVVQSEGGRPVVGFRLDVPAGETRRVVLDLELVPRAPGGYELLLVPSARVRPTQVTVELTGGEGMTGTVALDRPWRFREGTDPRPLAPPSGRTPEGRVPR
jgi:hypothetical protein